MRSTVCSILVACVLTLFGCGNEKPPQVATASPPRSAPTPAAPTRLASPNVAVSDDLAKACKLTFGAIEKAPKFEFDRSDLLPADRDVLQQVASCVTTGPLKGRSLRLVGHTDARGETEYNLSLGDWRAGTARSYLTQLGVAPQRVSETSRGELDATGTDEPSWQRDRRVDILLQ